MLSRFEYNVQTGSRKEVRQTVYRDNAGGVLVLDSGLKPPPGFSEFTGDLSELAPKEEEEKPLG